MLIQQLIIFSLFAVVFITLMAGAIKVKRAGGEYFGRPTISLPLHIFGKVSLFIPPGFLLLQAAGFDLSWLEVPIFLRWVGIFIFFESVLFLSLSLLHLGRFTKVGLPKTDVIELKTNGIYKLSRNPMYVGLILLAVASVIYVPNPVNLIFAVVGAILHHQIILKEEKFLAERFGDTYMSYKKSTKRYL